MLFGCLKQIQVEKTPRKQNTGGFGAVLLIRVPQTTAWKPACLKTTNLKWWLLRLKMFWVIFVVRPDFVFTWFLTLCFRCTKPSCRNGTHKIDHISIWMFISDVVPIQNDDFSHAMPLVLEKNASRQLVAMRCSCPWPLLRPWTPWGKAFQDTMRWANSWWTGRYVT